MGWERKRGKLEQLLCWMAQGGASPFLALGACSQPRDGTPYVLTLDSDTGLPPGALRELVAVAAHPLNQPQLDPLQRRVIAGYGILQPRLLSPIRSLRLHADTSCLSSGRRGLSSCNRPPPPRRGMT